MPWFSEEKLRRDSLLLHRKAALLWAAFPLSDRGPKTGPGESPQEKQALAAATTQVRMANGLE